MSGLLTGCALLPVPSVAKAQRTVSRAAFTAVSTGSTVHREGLGIARLTSQVPMNALERATGADASPVRRRVDDRFDDLEACSDRAEDRFLRTLLSTSQRTHAYAELVDDHVAAVVPGDGECGN